MLVPSPAPSPGAGLQRPQYFGQLGTSCDPHFLPQLQKNILSGLKILNGFFWFGVRAQKISGRQNPTRINYFSQGLFIGLEAEFNFTGQFKNSLVLGTLRSLQISPPKFTDLPAKGNFPSSPRAPWPYSVVMEETLGGSSRGASQHSPRGHIRTPPAQTQVLWGGNHPTSLTEHTEWNGWRHVAAVAAPDPALESAGVLTADLGEAQRRVRALLQPLAVPVPGIEGLLGCTQSP